MRLNNSNTNQWDILENSKWNSISHAERYHVRQNTWAHRYLRRRLCM